MHVLLDDFRSMPATHIVSLGRDCATAYNLRRFYDFDGAFPFDWWVTPDGTGLAQFLSQPTSEALYDPSRLELSSQGTSVRHKQYGFSFHHEFQRLWSVEGQPVRPDWHEHLDLPRERTTALIQKLMSLNNPAARIAFVRAGPTPSEIAENLEKLFNRATWTLCLLEIQPPGVGKDGWKGDTNGWDSTLARLEISLDRSAHRSFSGQAEPTHESLRRRDEITA